MVSWKFVGSCMEFGTHSVTKSRSSNGKKHSHTHIHKAHLTWGVCNRTEVNKINKENKEHSIFFIHFAFIVN